MPTVRDVVCVIYALDNHYMVSAVRCIYPLEIQLVIWYQNRLWWFFLTVQWCMSFWLWWFYWKMSYSQGHGYVPKIRCISISLHLWTGLYVFSRSGYLNHVKKRLRDFPGLSHEAIFCIIGVCGPRHFCNRFVTVNHFCNRFCNCYM